MADRPPTLAYGLSSSRTRRRTVLIASVALVAVLLGHYGWKFAKPYIDQQRYLAEERKWHAFFLPAESIVQSNDPLMIKTLLKPGQIPWGYNTDAGRWESVTRVDIRPNVPKLGAGGDVDPAAFICLLRSPSGTERIVRVGTKTVPHFRHAFPAYIVYFIGETRNLSTWQPGNRGVRWFFGGPTDYLKLHTGHRLTIYAGVRSADQTSVTLPYRLNEQPGEFRVTLNDDGTISITVQSGNAKLVK